MITFLLKIKITLFIVQILLFFISYITIREIIWSIMWCDKGGKYRKLQEEVRQRPIMQRILQTAYGTYIDAHKKEYLFWMRIKWGFLATEGVFWLAQIVLLIWKANSALMPWFIFACFVFSVCTAVVLRVQLKGGRETKYDAIRRGKKKGK